MSSRTTVGASCWLHTLLASVACVSGRALHDQVESARGRLEGWGRARSTPRVGAGSGTGAGNTEGKGRMCAATRCGGTRRAWAD
eukprot:10246314-Alexandrium_andersonii.AAC.1